MAAPVMPYAAYSAISGDTYIEKLHDFALAQGWTINEWRQANSAWDIIAPYTGWQGGSESYLEIQSPTITYGGNHYKYAFRNYHYDGSHDGFMLGAAYSGTTYATNTANHPLVQPAFCWGPGATFREISIPQASIAGAWFFGNEYCIWSVIQPTSGMCIVWGLGTPTLYPEYYNAIETQFIWACHERGNEAGYRYNEVLTHLPQWYSGDSFPFSTSVSGYTYCLMENNLRTTTAYYDPSVAVGQDAIELHYWAKEDAAVVMNSYNAIRPGIQPSVAIKRQATGIWEEIGTMPFYKIRTSGLAPGDTLTYGAEQYLAFPNVISSYTWGTMFRIA